MDHSQKSLISKLAETGSALGAGILGAGLGVYLSEDLKPIQWVLITAGGFLHLFGMIVMRKENKYLENLSLLWKAVFQVFFWGCIILLTGLLIWVFNKKT